MRLLRLRSIAVLGCLIIFMVHGCATGLHSTAVVGTVMYSHGSRQDTAMLRIALPPADIYAVLLRTVGRHPDLEIVNQDIEQFLIEVDQNDMRFTGQATDLGNKETLLFLWADAGESGKTGSQLIQKAINEICADLTAECHVMER